jgi:hypothetical protein
MGVSGSTVVRRRAPCEGGVVTTSGSKRLFSARSIAAVQALRVPVLNIGAEIIRRAAASPRTRHPAHIDTHRSPLRCSLPVEAHRAAGCRLQSAS